MENSLVVLHLNKQTKNVNNILLTYILWHSTNSKKITSYLIMQIQTRDECILQFCLSIIFVHCHSSKVWMDKQGIECTCNWFLILMLDTYTFYIQSNYVVSKSKGQMSRAFNIFQLYQYVTIYRWYFLLNTFHEYLIQHFKMRRCERQF